jgi:hypothetical protein
MMSCMLASSLLLAPPPVVDGGPAPPAAATAPAQSDPTARGIEIVLELQAGDDRAEWPYEGVYRVKREIPIGYRVGGTAITAHAILDMPGYLESAARVEAVGRACRFVCAARSHDLMQAAYAGGYDVRGWGYCYALRFLVRLHAAGLAPAEQQGEVGEAIKFYLDALQRIEIPQVGGWSYSRAPSLDDPSPPATFMTAPCLLALFEAKAAGFDLDEAVVERGLDVLEASRTASGAVVYAMHKGAAESREGVPGAVGRMLSAETVLHLAGRSTPVQVRGAIDAFFTHWEWLEKRRQQQGTHVPPYGVAPYYFFFAHGWAAEAIELLPAHERQEYRRRLRETLMKVRDADGSWNDRVFERSRAFGTAVAIRILERAKLAPLPTWSLKDKVEAEADAAGEAAGPDSP